jgi:plasmid maintenance system killer protein
MWRVEEHRRIGKQLASVPIEIQKRYEKWLDIATISGPPGLRAIRGFHDEALSGTWSGYRSSRLNIQYRVIYRALFSEQLFQVFEVTPHDYRKR